MIEISGLIICGLVGTLIGLLIGLVPGLGVSSTFLLLAPALVSVQPVYSLFIFVSLLVSSQYFGSVTALVFGVPGEMSSYPIINERQNLLGQLDNLLNQTAIGSLFASLAAVVIFVTLMHLGSLWVYLYNYKVFAWVLGFAIIATLIFGGKNNGIILNLVLLLAGYFIAKVGFDKELGQSWGTFGLSQLTQGIPTAAVALGLLVIPGLFSNGSESKFQMSSIIDAPITYTKQWFSILRGSALGILGGLVPGATYMASTQLSYFIENKISENDKDRSIKAVVATSSADNAGAVSSLYPLLWIGVPISLGESVLVWLFEKHNTNLNWSTLNQTLGGIPLYWYLIACFVVSNVLSYFLSWPGRKISISIAKIMLKRKANYIILLAILISIILMASEHFNQLVFYISFGIASTIGLLIKKIDWMPLIMGLVLYDSLSLTLLKLGITSI